MEIDVPPPLNQISKLFNNQDYSDCTVHLSKRTLYLNKSILCIHSDYFRACFAHGMKEAREGVIYMDDGDDAELMEALLKSLYTGKIEMKNQKDIALMVVLAEKYQLNTLMPALLDTLLKSMDESNVLHCAMLNLENEQFQAVKQKMSTILSESADAILRGDSYLTLTFDQWLSVVRVLVTEKNVLEAVEALLMWIKFDEKNRVTHSPELMYAVTQAARIDAKTPKFEPKFCGSKAKLSHGNKHVIKSGAQGFNCAVLATKCDNFSIRLLKNCGRLRVGMAPKKLDREGANYNKRGVFYDCGTNSIFGSTTLRHDLALDFTVQQEGIIEVSLNGQTMTIWGFGWVFETRVPAIDLYPAFLLYDDGCEFEIV